MLKKAALLLKYLLVTGIGLRTINLAGVFPERSFFKFFQRKSVFFACLATLFDFLRPPWKKVLLDDRQRHVERYE